MPIPAQDIADALRFALDAEDAEHYNDAKDIIPAINLAQNWLVSVINKTLGDKKLGDEIFRDLSEARVFETSVDSRVSLDIFPTEPWTILAVYKSPTTKTTGLSTPARMDDKQSLFRQDLYHVSATDSLKRLTIEEWATNTDNPFKPGYDGSAICDALKKGAYLDPFDYASGSSVPMIQEIEIRPAISKGNVTVFYVKKPTEITGLGQSVDFPESVKNLLVNKALNYIAYKQGDQTNAFAVSQNDIALLVQTIN